LVELVVKLPGTLGAVPVDGVQIEDAGPIVVECPDVDRCRRLWFGIERQVMVEELPEEGKASGRHGMIRSGAALIEHHRLCS
jgi:hypothetical protein